MRILTILDDAEDRRQLREILGAAHTVVEVLDAARAESALSGDEPIDLLFIDQPNLEELAQNLRFMREQDHPLFIPVVFVTREDAKATERWIWDEVDELITSPIIANELETRVSTLLRTRRLSRLAHAELHQIIDSAGSAMCVVGTDRKVRRVNAAFARLVGQDAARIKGRRVP